MKKVLTSHNLLIVMIISLLSAAFDNKKKEIKTTIKEPTDAETKTMANMQSA